MLKQGGVTFIGMIMLSGCCGSCNKITPVVSDISEQVFTKPDDAKDGKARESKDHPSWIYGKSEKKKSPALGIKW